MFSWMSGLQNPLIQNDFKMFLDKWMGVKVLAGVADVQIQNYLCMNPELLT